MRLIARSIRIRDWYRTVVKPAPDGLPNARVIFVPLLILAAVLVGLVSLGITGSSTGVLQPSFEVGHDPNLLANTPKAIRSDEWYVQTSWTISQVQQGLPIDNQAFPGGMDATVQHDLPTWDWSMVFRPHLLGFWFLPLDNAMALKWWLPGFALIAAVYLFAVLLLPRRPIAAAMFAVAFFCSPFFQWWYLSITFYPVAWALLVMAATVWMLRRPRGPGRWVFAALAGYFTVTVGTGIYVPFIVPAVYVALGFVAGATLTRQTSPSQRLAARVRAIVPLLFGGAAGVAIMALWLLTRWQTIQAFTATVYPGERLTATGSGDRLMQLKALLTGPFQTFVEQAGGQPFDKNSSEASTFLLPGLLLAVPVAWLIIRSVRRRSADWTLVALVAVGLVFAAFVLVPGWDAVAHLFFLDRTTTIRLRLGWGLLSIVVMVVVASRLDRQSNVVGPRSPTAVLLGAIATAVVSVVAIAWILMRAHAFVVEHAPVVWVVVGVLLVCVVGLVTLGRVNLAALALLVASLTTSSAINPLYVGVFDLNQTNTSRAMRELAHTEPGRWLGVGVSLLPTVLLVQSGLPSFNGFQSSPSREMWDLIDPGLDQKVWNRLANVSWEVGSGPPAARNPEDDQIRLTFDSCNTFAQANVAWVLADEPINQRCVALERSVVDGPSTFWIYRVAKSG